MTGDLWERLRPGLDDGKADRVAALLKSVDETERLTAAKPLEAYVRTLSEHGWERQSAIVRAIGVAAVGCLPSAARAGTLLCRRDVRWHWDDLSIPLMVELATIREIDWLGALALRMAAKLDARGWGNDWRPVADLVLAGGATPPADAPFVRGWLLARPIARHNARHDTRPVPLADRLRDDPFLDPLLPAVFELDGIGDVLGNRGWSAETGSWDTALVYPTALAALAAEGRVDRKLLLDGCVSRFLRGDRPGALRAFVALHDALEPTLDEAVERRLDYVRLLSEAPAPVALLALKALKPVDDAGQLELTTLLDASAAVLRREEKGLVRKQLVWLDRLVRRHPDRAGEVLATLATACGHPALDVQERALTGLARHRARLDPASLGGALEELDASLHARAVELLGVTVAAPEPAPFWIPAGIAPPAPMPPPIGGPAELAEEIAVLATATSGTAVAWERILAALVSLRATDPAALTEALAPVLATHHETLTHGHWTAGLLGEFGEAVRSAIGTRRRGPAWQRAITAVRLMLNGGQPDLLEFKVRPSPRRVLALRLAEIAVQLDRAPVPALVATPTSANGQLDAATLVERLARAEEAGWQPWRLDLEQAMLRVSPEVDPLVVKRAEALRSPGGRWVAEWFAAGGLATPAPVRTEQRLTSDHYSVSPDPGRRVVVGLQPAGPSRGIIEEMLCDIRFANRAYHLQYQGADVWWPAVLPYHREVIAAWALPNLAAMADSDARDDGPILPVLAECGGPVGPAMTLALTYTLAARQEADRVAGVDALLTLATDPRFDAAAVGRELGGLGADSAIKVGRVVPGLTDAFRAGAGAAVWDIVAAAVPYLLSAAKPPPGTPDLLALGTQTAAALGRRTPIEAVAGVAARGGGSRLVTEARRLHQTLTA
ncbi:DUF6493 family protein [Polymorphospora sp. NPDC051019]|uniref:DUF6493 family protein n=1 Tax=Polymorphospora sp. NPDC051019 TaxID=3155725 RepID=UPI0034451E01